MTIDQLIAHLQRQSQIGRGSCPAVVGGHDQPLLDVEVIEVVDDDGRLVVVLRHGSQS